MEHVFIHIYTPRVRLIMSCFAYLLHIIFWVVGLVIIRYLTVCVNECMGIGLSCRHAITIAHLIVVYALSKKSLQVARQASHEASHIRYGCDKWRANWRTKWRANERANEPNKRAHSG